MPQLHPEDSAPSGGPRGIAAAPDRWAPAPVRFGPLDHQELSSDVASMMLTLWRERNPAQFGAILAEAMTGTAPRAARGRKAD